MTEDTGTRQDLLALPRDPAIIMEMLDQKVREVVYLKTALELAADMAPGNIEVHRVTQYATKMAYLETVEDRPLESWVFR